MNRLRLNTSSAIDSVIPCHAPYQASDSSGDPLPTAPGEIQNGPIRDLSRPAGSSVQGDRISISLQARSLYDVSAASHPGTASTGLAEENIALYNQIRHERDTLPPGDPRFLDLTKKLQTVLMAGGKILAPEDIHWTPQATHTPNPAPSQAIEQLPNASPPKKRHSRHLSRYSQDSGDTTEAALFSAHASASASSHIHRADLSTLEQTHAGLPTSRRLYRVA